MRVAGHISAAGRDLARMHATNGDLQQAAAAYQDLVSQLEEIQTPQTGVAADIHAHLLEAAMRDHATLNALSGGEIPDVARGLAALRMEYYKLSRAPDPAALQQLQTRLEEHLTDRPDLALDAFSDFNSRHQLRIELFEAYLDSLDPIGINERWGYWRASEIQRQALLLGVAAGWLGGDDWTQRAQRELIGEIPQIPVDAPAWQWPSILADTLHSKDQQPQFSVDGLGWLPTGDSLIDVAGSPGPLAIGSLMKLGLDDNAHRIWLEETKASLQPLLESDPSSLLGEARARTTTLDAFTHGSRFYNVKQLRNEVVRQLAKAGHYRAAADMLSDNFPLHHQDWACPNREGILLAISGRLLAEAGHDTAEDTLRRSLTAAASFLDQVELAEQNPGQGQRPPALHQGRGPAGQQHNANRPGQPQRPNNPGRETPQ